MKCFISQISLINPQCPLSSCTDQTHYYVVSFPNTVWSPWARLEYFPTLALGHRAVPFPEELKLRVQAKTHSVAPAIFPFTYTISTFLFLKINPEESKLNEQKTLSYFFLNQFHLPSLLEAAWGILYKHMHMFEPFYALFHVFLFFVFLIPWTSPPMSIGVEPPHSYLTASESSTECICFIYSIQLSIVSVNVKLFAPEEAVSRLMDFLLFGCHLQVPACHAYRHMSVPPKGKFLKANWEFLPANVLLQKIFLL